MKNDCYMNFFIVQKVDYYRYAWKVRYINNLAESNVQFKVSTNSFFLKTISQIVHYRPPNWQSVPWTLTCLQTGFRYNSIVL
jgi:hypothetical protein